MPCAAYDLPQKRATPTGNTMIAAVAWTRRTSILADAVRDGRISDLDAKVSWQQMLVDMRAANDAAILGILAAQPKIQAAPAAVKPAGITSTNRTTMVSTYGGIATTNCQGVSR